MSEPQSGGEPLAPSPAAEPELADGPGRRLGRMAVIAAAALGLVILGAGPHADVDALVPWFLRLGLVTVVWLVTGPLWHLPGSGARALR